MEEKMKHIFTGAFVLALVFTGILNLHAADDFIIDEPNYVDPSASSAPSQSPETSPAVTRIPFIGSVPTTDNLMRGDFLSQFSMYDNGGVNIRLLVGIFGMLSIGVSENFDGLIGADKITVNIPVAYIKFSLYEQSQWMNFSMGFDHFAYGHNGAYFDPNGISSSIYGFYANIGQNYYVFGEKNIFTFGIRIPLLPEGMRSMTNSTFFFGATLNTRYLHFGITVENIYADFTRVEHILPSFIIAFVPIPSFQLGFTLQYEFFSLSFNRVLSLGYTAKF
jgi:hypothetical protein